MISCRTQSQDSNYYLASIMSSEAIDKLLGSEHYSSLVKELQCPCGGYLEPPIKLCTNGHGACCRCRRKLQKCPTCEDTFSETRSIALEALADKLQFPCPHVDCSVKVPLRQLEVHTEECNYRNTSCFMAKVYGNCNWNGKASDWLKHCIQSHGERVTDLPFVTFNGPWSPKKSPIMRYHLLRCFERIFNVYQIYDSKTCKMMWSVVMTQEERSDDKVFYFDLEMFTPTNVTKKITFRQICKTTNDSDILDIKANVLIPLEQILYMLDRDKDIHFKLTINELNED